MVQCHPVCKSRDMAWFSHADHVSCIFKYPSRFELPVFVSAHVRIRRNGFAYVVMRRNTLSNCNSHLVCRKSCVCDLVPDLENVRMVYAMSATVLKAPYLTAIRLVWYTPTQTGIPDIQLDVQIFHLRVTC